MGLYINMEMPKDRPQLLWVYPNGKALIVQSDVDPWKDLQAVPIPTPHGRLIDAAVLWVEINKICDRRDAGIITDLTCLQQLLSAVRHAPTIIPAEEA